MSDGNVVVKRNWKFVEGPEAAKSWGQVGGRGAERLPGILESLDELKKGVSLKGNLFEPVLTAAYPGYPMWAPINFLAYPERRLEAGMHTIEPGYGIPVHIHDYADELYLVVRGKGKILIDEKEYDAEQFDVFYVPAGVWHTAYNPEGNTEDFCVFMTASPPLAFAMRQQGWELTENLWLKLGYKK